MRQEPERKPEPHPTRGETATPPALKQQKNKTYGSGQRKENIMKNNTFDQIINANLASIDPGFGQFALAKASADLFKKVINK